MCVKKKIVILRQMFGLIFSEFKIGHCWKTIFISVQFANGINNHLNFFRTLFAQIFELFLNSISFFFII